MRFVLYLFDFVMFHEHVFFVCQKYKTPYYAEIWRLPNSRQDDDQNVQLLEHRHDQQRCKIVKKREFPTSGWDRVAAHEPRKKQANQWFRPALVSGKSLRKNRRKNEKTLFSKGLEECHTKKKQKITCCVPTSNNAIVTPIKSKAIFSSKNRKSVFLEGST